MTADWGAHRSATVQHHGSESSAHLVDSVEHVDREAPQAEEVSSASVLIQLRNLDEDFVVDIAVKDSDRDDRN